MNINKQHLDLLVSDFIEETVVELTRLKEQKKIVIGLSGGNSLTPFYLSFSSILKRVDSSIRRKILFVYLDERNVPLDSNESNYKTTSTTFLNDLVSNGIISHSQIRILVKSTVDNYLNDFDIDLALFGVGEDGHIASLFPSKLNKYSKIESNYSLITDSIKLPLERFTITVKGLSKIQKSWCFFIGSSKQQALTNLLNAQVKSPITFLKNVTIFTDQKVFIL